MSERKVRLTGAAIMMLGAVAFSGKAVLVKLAYRHGVDAVTLLALRMIFAAPMFALLAWWAVRDPATPSLTRSELVSVCLLGMLGYYLASYFDFVGLQYITAGLERLILFTHPTIVLAIVAVMFSRPITLRDVVALVLTYLGIGLAVGHDVLTQPGNVLLGSFWVLMSALLYAIYLVGSGRLVGRVGSLRFACYAGMSSGAGIVIHYLVVTPMPGLILAQPAPVYWLALLMAAASTVLPIIATAEGIRRIGASHASMVSTVGPVATIFLGFIFLDEPITAIQLVGAALVLAGVVAISIRKSPPL